MHEIEGIYLNSQGLINNFNEIEYLTLSQSFDFVCLSETHLSDYDDDNLININGYNFIRIDSATRHTGGCLIYLKEYWNFKIIKKLNKDLEYWMLGIKVWDKRNIFYVITIYRAPHYFNIENFATDLNFLFDELVEKTEKIILVGDFNMNWLINNNITRKIKNIICDNGFVQLIKQFTRITKDSKTLIDYVIVNDKYNIKACVDDKMKISDHETLKIKIITKNKKDPKQTELKILKYDKQKLIRQLITSEILTVYYLNCNSKADIFSNTFRNIISEQIVLIKRTNITSNNWFSNELHSLKQNKVAQYKIATYTNNEIEWNKYKSIRNEYKNNLHYAKKNHISNKIQNCRDQKHMWKNIKKLVLNETRGKIKNVNFANRMYTNDLIIANKFNRYFINSVQEINNSIPLRQYKNHINNITTTFKFKLITLNELKTIIDEIKNKSDMNFINTEVIKDSFELIGENLLSILNCSLSEGTFPDVWKETLVIPIPKIKNTCESTEFRPINIIPTEAKILERIVYNQLEFYFENNQLISNYQSGFRKGHSCESLLNLVITNWKMAVNGKKCIIAVFIDLKRAFETINRDILTLKLKKYGIKNTELEWFRSYLNNRKQRTRVNNTVSDVLNVEIGVPQGSILGVLLFLIYINDMEKCVDLARLVLFADDALLYIIDENIEQAVIKMNAELQKVYEWLEMNKLKLNISKTNCMIINGSTTSNVTFNNTIIIPVTEIKYLGVIIDKSLKFKNHIDYIAKKIAKKNYFLSKIRNKITLNTVIKIYNTMIKPHFEYCPSILFTYTNEEKTRLQRLQNKGMRIVLKLNRFTPMSSLLECLKWMSVNQKICYNVLIMVFKVKYNLLPKYLSDMLTYVGDVHQYNLRNINDFRLSNVRNEQTKNMLMYKGIKLFNELPASLKTETNIKIFKKNCYEHVKNCFQ